MDTVKERSPKNKPKMDFVPVIFANGEDDDLPGLVAAVKNERVQLDDAIYKPGEDVVVDGRPLFLSGCLYVIGKGGTPPESPRKNDVVVVVEKDLGRHVEIANCHIMGDFGDDWSEFGWS